MKLYPEAEGEFEFCDRNKVRRTQGDVEQINRYLKALEELALTDEEYNWCRTHITYIPQFYWEWLRGFRFDSSLVKVWLDDKYVLHMTVQDKLYRLTLWEIACLAIVSEVSNRAHIIQMGDVLKRLDEKIALSNEYGLVFSEFGTRRRFSYAVQDAVVKRLNDNALYCVGTSNVHLAMKYDMKPIGTVAHEWIMFHGAQFGYRNANYTSYEDWVKVYDGALGIALTDTYTSRVFFDTFTLKQAKLFDGVRHDSGDEYEFTQMTIDTYKKYGIDPKDKTIVFSNALTFPKFKEIADYCKGKIRCSAGIGTNLTCDTNTPSQNIVMKLMKCRLNANRPWVDCIKISDDKGKVMGSPTEIQIANTELNLGIEL
jgi:nicotinate phosphoribosyltransferase